MLGQLPQEHELTESRDDALGLERALVGRVLVLSPFAAALAWFVAGQWGRYLVLLNPARLSDSPWRWLRAPEGIAAAVGVVAVAAAWRLALRSTPRSGPARRDVPWAALCAALLLLVVNLALASRPARAAFETAVDVRAPRGSFDHSVVKWRVAERSPATLPARAPVALVGSSQVNLGTDERRLSALLGGTPVAKLAIPGFNPLLYALAAELPGLRGRPVVVVYLSEFDMFRNDHFPVEQLRWASRPRGVMALAQSLPPRLLWRERSGVADLALASVLPLWRERDLAQRLAFHAWWADSVRPSAAEDPVATLTLEARRAHWRAVLTPVVQKTDFLDANFGSVAQFASALRARGSHLLVIEGQTNPGATSAYPAGFRTETRERMAAVAAASGALYVSGAEAPFFPEERFTDSVHLDSEGRTELTQAIAGQLMKRLGGAVPGVPAAP